MGSNCATWVPKPWWQIKQRVYGGISSGCLSPAHLFASCCQRGNITVCKLGSWAFKKLHCLFCPLLHEWRLLCPITHRVAGIRMYNQQLQHEHQCTCRWGICTCANKYPQPFLLISDSPSLQMQSCAFYVFAAASLCFPVAFINN